MTEDIKFTKREEELHQHWEAHDTKVNIPVDSSQYSFDSDERKRKFSEDQFETEELLEKYRDYRKEWHRRAKEFDPGDKPLAVCCELVSTCNLNCPMCYTITEEFQASAIGAQRFLPWATVKRVIDECAELEIPSMLFSWRGESAIYRARDFETGKIKTFVDVLQYARDKGILEVTSLTNGSMFKQSTIEGIVNAEPNWISFSIDGLEENYNKIRTPVNKKNKKDFNAFKNVIKNLKEIVRLRDERGQKRPKIRVNTIYPPISEDPKAYQEFMASIGVDWVTVNEILDFREDALPDDAVIKNWACQYPFQRLVVSANGSILPCTGAHNEEDDLLLARYKGSIVKKIVTKEGVAKTIEYPEMSLKEAWHCDKLKKIREIHKNNQRLCLMGCRNCRHGAIKHGVEWVPDEWNMETQEWEGGTWRE